MRVYAHWLDGWYRKLASEDHGESSVDQQAMRVIKLHALFGDRLIFSGQQIADNPVIWSLFADADFRAFARHDVPGFVSLVSHRAGVSDQPNWDVAASGLKRIANLGHATTATQDQNATVSLARSILEKGRLKERQFF